MNIVRVPINQVKGWDKNPRGIRTADFDRLKKQIQRLGVYKPLIACKNGAGYTVLGGNMRLTALSQLGHTEVDLSVVEAPTEADRLRFALSDNDRAGFYDEAQLGELITDVGQEIELEDYKIDLGEPMDLKSVLAMDDIEGLLDGAYSKFMENNRELFAMTFYFPKDQATLAADALKAKSKDYWVMKILELFRAEVAEAAGARDDGDEEAGLDGAENA